MQKCSTIWETDGVTAANYSACHKQLSTDNMGLPPKTDQKIPLTCTLLPYQITAAVFYIALQWQAMQWAVQDERVTPLQCPLVK